MKTTIITIIALVLNITAFAQENYYIQQSGSYTVTDDKGNDIVYNYMRNKKLPWRVVVYNAGNKFIGVEPLYKDGTLVTGNVYLGVIPSFDDTPKFENMDQVVSGIIYNEFTPEQKRRLRGQQLHLRMLMNTDTGRVQEIEFDFDSQSLYSSLPADFFSRIEQAIINHPDIVIQLTDVGRTRNYIPINWHGEPKPEGQFVW